MIFLNGFLVAESEKIRRKEEDTVLSIRRVNSAPSRLCIVGDHELAAPTVPRPVIEHGTNMQMQVLVGNSS